MKISDRVYLLDSVPNGHVFLVKGEENILIDTGMPGFASKIAAELLRLGIEIKSLNKILLTHHDMDHIGNAKALQELSGAELWAPALDVPFITTKQKRPGIKRFVSMLMKAPTPLVTGTYDVRQEFSGIHAISASGHTPGHTIFQYENVVFAGDLLQTPKGKVSLLPSIMTWDMTMARKSIGILKTLNFEWLCPAHGHPIKNDKALKEFLERF